MQSFLKNAFVPSTDSARLVSYLLAIVAALSVCSASIDLLGSVPRDAVPTVGDLHIIIVGYVALTGSVALTASTLARLIVWVFRK